VRCARAAAHLDELDPDHDPDARREQRWAKFDAMGAWREA
jgi:hypothetical protein